MGLNKTPSANRVHIGFFGRMNAGKSSVVNAVTGQKISIVTDIKGTTTDPVSKSMELLPVGPVVIIDTPGFDDKGIIGEMRVDKAKRILNKTDVAILVVDATIGIIEHDKKLIELFEAKNLPYLIVYNKNDLKNVTDLKENEIAVSTIDNENIYELKERIAQLVKQEKVEKKIVGDILQKSDVIVLVTPIDSSAPRGRLILPQVQTIRDILDTNGICIVTQTDELTDTLDALVNPPILVVTDSQAFGDVKKMVPENIPLTSFSILFARYKGILKTALKGAASIEKLLDNDKVLISEGCTHHRQCDDIGTVKLPGWIEKHTGKALDFEFVSGGTFPDELQKYKLIVHCGGCMLNEKEMLYRQKCSEDAEVPFTNFGTLIAYINGILKTSVSMFPDVAAETEGWNQR